MASFGSNYYEAEPGVYLPIPYGGSYDSVSRHHALTSYSFYESHADPFVDAYDPTMTRMVISYSVSIGSWSKLFVYGPFHSQIIASYNKSGYNKPDFEEYDPTPYGGGCDIDQTYGKPLPHLMKYAIPNMKKRLLKKRKASGV